MSKIKNMGLMGLGLFAALASSGCAGSTSNASVAVKQSVQASGLASSGAAHALAASGQAALAVSSVPLAVSGAVLSGAAKASMNAASAPAGTALPLTDQTITVIPPNQALKK